MVNDCLINYIFKLGLNFLTKNLAGKFFYKLFVKNFYFLSFL